MQLPDVNSSQSHVRALQEIQQNDQEVAVHASSKPVPSSTQETEKQQKAAAPSPQAGIAGKGGLIC
jgi:hypothetical protein